MKPIARSRAGRYSIEVVAINYACQAGYYDTNYYFHIPNGIEKEPLVALKRLRFLPPGATYHFAIQVERTGYLVTLYDDRWVVEFDDKTEDQKRERQLREGVLSNALRYFSEQLGDTLEDGEYLFAKKLLNEGLHPHLRNTFFAGHHPIVNDEPPSGNMRRWSVTVGSHRCVVGLVKDTREPEFAILSS